MWYTLNNNKMKLNTVLISSIILMIIFSCNDRSLILDIAYSSDVTGNPEIFLTNSEGKPNQQITFNDTRDGYPSWSPNGKKIVFYSYHGIETWSIYMMDSDGNNRKRLTFSNNKWDNSPSWSPDGKMIAFAREYSDTLEIWTMKSNGDELKQIKSINGGSPCYTYDGRILFHSQYRDSEICIVDTCGNNFNQLTNNDAEDWHPKISPDNTEIVFMSDRDGNYEIYVMNIDGANQRRLTNNDEGDWGPSWSPDGSKILFTSERDGDFDIYIMSKDGTSVKNISNNDAKDLQASWLKLN